MLTKKHFEILANAMFACRPPDDSQTSGVDQGERDLLRARDEQWMKDVEYLCCALREINPRFNQETFTDWIQARGRAKFKKK